MAEALMKQKLPTTIVSSAGIGALVGHSADPIAIELMQSRGLDITIHRAQQITDDLCVQNDIILVMEDSHKKYIEDNFPTTRGRVFKLGQASRVDIPDPYKQDKTAFDFSLALIEHGVNQWAEKIAKL